MSNLSEKVREIINMQDSIKSKVSCSIISLDKEISDLDENISTLTNMYVQREIAGDIDGLGKVKESIDEAIRNKESLKFRKEAYQKATVNNKDLQDELQQVFDLALETYTKRIASIKSKEQQIEKLNADIKEIQKNIEQAKQELYTLNNKSEERELRPLLQYIEKRKIKTLCEEPYLRALIHGGIGAAVEQYIQEEITEKKPGPINICTSIKTHY